MNENPKSTWTRDLLDTPFGRFLNRFVFSIALAAIAVRAFILQKIRLRSYEYEGFEATCNGIGLMAAAIALVQRLSLEPAVIEFLEEEKQGNSRVAGNSGCRFGNRDCSSYLR